MSEVSSSSSGVSGGVPGVPSSLFGFSLVKRSTSQSVNWKFVIERVDIENYDMISLPRSWFTSNLVTFITYQVEKDGVNSSGFRIRGILRLPRRSVYNTLYDSLLGPLDPNYFHLFPYGGVLDSKYFGLELDPKLIYGGHSYEFGSKFVPRQGRRILFSIFDDKNPRHHPYKIPECTNRCSCCSSSFELKKRIRLLEGQLTRLGSQLDV